MASKGLGKGLSTLIADKQGGGMVAAPAATYDADGMNILKIKTENLSPGRFQPRQYFNEDELHELADSIQKNGMFQPIIARKLEGDNYEIIAGERRWRAAKICGLDDVPVIVMGLDDKQALEIGIIENVQRQDLTVLEVAEGYQRLMKEFSYTQEDLSEVIGKSRSAIANSIRLLSLPKEVKILIHEEKISAGHARTLLVAKNPVEVANIVVKKGLNVRQTEELVKKLSNPSAAKKQKITDPELRSLEKEITAKVGHKIAITNTGDDGKIVISYTNLEELDVILNKLKS